MFLIVHSVRKRNPLQCIIGQAELAHKQASKMCQALLHSPSSLVTSIERNASVEAGNTSSCQLELN